MGQTLWGSYAIGNPGISHQSEHSLKRSLDRYIHYRQDDRGYNTWLISESFVRPEFAWILIKGKKHLHIVTNAVQQGPAIYFLSVPPYISTFGYQVHSQAFYFYLYKAWHHLSDSSIVACRHNKTHQFSMHVFFMGLQRAVTELEQGNII